MQVVHANPVLLPEAAAAGACVLVLYASLQLPMLLHLEDAGSMMVQMWFTLYSGCISQPLYEGWFLALFNLLYIIFPGLYIKHFEPDMCKKQSLELAELYITGLSLFGWSQKSQENMAFPVSFEISCGDPQTTGSSFKPLPMAKQLPWSTSSRPCGSASL